MYWHQGWNRNIFMGWEKATDVIILMMAWACDAAYWLPIYCQPTAVLRGHYSGVIHCVWIAL